MAGAAVALPDPRRAARVQVRGGDDWGRERDEGNVFGEAAVAAAMVGAAGWGLGGCCCYCCFGGHP